MRKERTKKDIMLKVEKECLQALISDQKKISLSFIKKAAEKHNGGSVTERNILQKLRKRLGDDVLQRQGWGNDSFYKLRLGTPSNVVEDALKELSDVDLTAKKSEKKPKEKANKRVKPVVVFQQVLSPSKKKVTDSIKDSADSINVEVKTREELINDYIEKRKLGGDTSFSRGNMDPEVLNTYFGMERNKKEWYKVMYRTAAFLNEIRNLLGDNGEEVKIPYYILDRLDRNNGGRCKDYKSFLYVIYVIGGNPYVEFKKDEKDLYVKGLNISMADEIQDAILNKGMKQPENAFELAMKTRVESIINSRHSIQIVVPQQPKEKEIIKEVVVEKVTYLSVPEKDMAKTISSLYALFESNSNRQEAVLEELKEELREQFFFDVSEEKYVFQALDYLSKEKYIEYDNNNGIIKICENFTNAVERFPLKERFTAYLTTRWSEATVKKFVKDTTFLGELKNGMNLFILKGFMLKRDVTNLYELKALHDGSVQGEELKCPELNKVFAELSVKGSEDPKGDCYELCYEK